MNIGVDAGGVHGIQLGDKFIEKFHDEVTISLGHSTASYEIASKAFAAFSACLEITASS